MYLLRLKVVHYYGSALLWETELTGTLCVTSENCQRCISRNFKTDVTPCLFCGDLIDRLSRRYGSADLTAFVLLLVGWSDNQVLFTIYNVVIYTWLRGSYQFLTLPSIHASWIRLQQKPTSLSAEGSRYSRWMDGKCG